jgi:acyl-coenzyme A thioesterase PaaI-like protein
MQHSLQDHYAAQSICYGCGPANDKGLKIKSVVEGDKVVARFLPKPEHQAFPGVLCGGIIGSVLDCHCNWSGSWYLMQAQQLQHPPCTVTAEYTIQLLRPTPMDTQLTATAQCLSIEGNKVWVSAELAIDQKIYAKAKCFFVAVNEDHPAYHRW